MHRGDPLSQELGNAVALEFVDLSANLLEGQIPRELGHLSKLHTLALGENHLSGPIPHELGSLPNLNMLQLTSNHFTGEIPSLDKLEKLTVLSMAENRLEGRVFFFFQERAKNSLFLSPCTALLVVMLGFRRFHGGRNL